MKAITLRKNPKFIVQPKSSLTGLSYRKTDSSKCALPVVGVLTNKLQYVVLSLTVLYDKYPVSLLFQMCFNTLIE